MRDPSINATVTDTDDDEDESEAIVADLSPLDIRAQEERLKREEFWSDPCWTEPL